MTDSLGNLRFNLNLVKVNTLVRNLKILIMNFSTHYLLSIFERVLAMKKYKFQYQKICSHTTNFVYNGAAIEFEQKNGVSSSFGFC